MQIKNVRTFKNIKVKQDFFRANGVPLWNLKERDIPQNNSKKLRKWSEKFDFRNQEKIQIIKDENYWVLKLSNL